MSATFRYLFEVKTAFDAVRGQQLVEHLKHLPGDDSTDERLFVVSPDASIPPAVLSVHDDRVAWFNFARLNAAFEVALKGEAVRDDERFLLRELQALFVEEGLLGRQDTVIVAARRAHPFYLAHHAYVCQPGRSFRQGLTHLGFYRQRRIECELPRIVRVEDDVLFTYEQASHRQTYGNPSEQAIGRLDPMAAE